MSRYKVLMRATESRVGQVISSVLHREPLLARRSAGAVLMIGALALTGCGSSNNSSSSAIELRVDRERAEAAANAHQEDKLKALEGEVHRLRHGHQGTTTVVAPSGSSSPPPPVAGSEVRLFHAPGGNVTCEVQAESARCAVASNDQTFVLPQGNSSAYTESGLALSAGSGSLAAYGTSVGVGSVTCAIPMQDEPKGIACTSDESSHGFEASKVSARQKAY